MKNSVIKFTCITLILSLTACGTMTGIPSHGGGKRFATEQRLVSASIRSSLKDIDLTPLRGKKVAVVFDIIADEDGGTLSGGRFNILGGATAGFISSPVTAAASAFQLFNLNDSGTSYSNTNAGGTMPLPHSLAMDQIAVMAALTKTTREVSMEATKAMLVEPTVTPAMAASIKMEVVIILAIQV